MAEIHGAACQKPELVSNTKRTKRFSFHHIAFLFCFVLFLKFQGISQLIILATPKR